MKKLNVKSTDYSEIIKHWGNIIPVAWMNRLLFVRCNAKGVINWEKTSVYRAEELIVRDNVSIIEDGK